MVTYSIVWTYMVSDCLCVLLPFPQTSMLSLCVASFSADFYVVSRSLRATLFIVSILLIEPTSALLVKIY